MQREENTVDTDLERENNIEQTVIRYKPSGKDKDTNDVPNNTKHSKDKEDNSADPKLDCLAQTEVYWLVTKVPGQPGCQPK